MAAKKTQLDEAPCQSRPTVVEVSKNHEHRPFFVILNRCSGSCSPHSPHVRTCTVRHWVAVDVVVRDAAGGETTKTMANHTDCECNCKSNPGMCDWSQVGQDWLPHRCTCKVQTGPVVGGSRNNEGKVQTTSWGGEGGTVSLHDGLGLFSRVKHFCVA